jgi:4-amino-4-deoxy-L-arabinose transferase-like glycosyltransferase
MQDGIRRRSTLLLAAAVAVAYFAFLGSVPLSQPDEGRYAEIAREMLERGDWVTPTQNYVVYFEKPTLQYWLTAGAFAVLGTNEWAARLWPALAALFGIAATGAVGRRLHGARTGEAAALILAASPLWYAGGRLAVLDELFSALCAGSLLAFVAFEHTDRPGTRRAAWAAFYVLAALATLTKGLIGVVFPALIVGAYIALTGRFALLRQLRLARGALVYLAVAAPWFVIASLRNPDFAWFFFVREHLLRYTTTLHRRDEPFYYFVVFGLGGLLPFTIHLLPALRDAVARARRAPRGAPSPDLFLLLWAGLVFAFFSASSSKLPLYILPIFPALALLTARRVAELDACAKPAGRWPWPHRACFLLLAAAGAAVLAAPALAARPGLAPLPPLLPIALPAAAGTAVALALAATRGRSHPTPWFALATLVLLLAGMQGWLETDSLHRRSRELSASLERLAAAEDPIVQLGVYQRSIPFYTGRRVVIVDWEGELGFGLERAADRDDWLWSADRFLEEWRSARRLWVVASERDLEGPIREPGIFEALSQFPPVLHDGKLVLLTNRPLAADDGSGESPPLD